MSQTGPTILILDGKDLGELGLIISQAPGWRGIPTTRRKSVRLAGRYGNVSVSNSLEIAPRIVVIEGVLVQDTLAERKAAEDEIGGRLAVAQVARFIDNNDRYMNVDVGEFTPVPLAAPFSAAEIGIRIQLTANDPLIYETSLTNVTFTVTKDNCPLGNTPVRPLITINGAVTNPVVSYRNSASVVKQTTTLALTPTAAQEIQIDSALHTVKLLTEATGILTLTGNAVNNETVIIDGKTYTWQTTLTDVDGNVHIKATASLSLDALIAAIVLGSGAGTDYAASTTLHPTVSAAAGAGDTMDVTAKTRGVEGNDITTTETMTAGSWGGGVLSSGATVNKIDDMTGSFIILDPDDADDQFASSPVWPTLECSPTASCEADYQKAYVS